MKLSKEARNGARILFNAVCAGGLLDESKVRQALGALEKRRPAQSQQILHEFHRLVRLQIERNTATVQTAVSLTPVQEAEIQLSLRQNFGSGLTANFSINPELLGGTRIQIGSDVYDSNVKNRLARLSQAFER
ncbi:MAG: H(+)-transporting ATPase [Verrucomicrobia bacterium]|nr:H(+)-transporting ATPase [Verrucomicrobiota bacterium]